MLPSALSNSVPQQIGIKDFVRREIIVSIALGGIPIALVAVFKGETQMLARLTSINPHDEIFAYFAVLLFIHGVTYLLNVHWYKRNEHVEAFVNSLHEITEQIGFGLHGVYRAVTGAIPLALCILMINHGLAGAAQATFLALILVPGALFMCCLMSWMNEKTKRRKRLF